MPNASGFMAEDYIESDYDDSSDDDSSDSIFNRITRPIAPFKPSPVVTGGTARTPQGSMPVNFSSAVASATALANLKDDTQKSIASLNSQIKEIREGAVKVEKRLGRQDKRMSDMAQSSQFSMLMPLLQSPPKIETIEFDSTPQVGSTSVKSTKYGSADMTMMMLPFLMGGSFSGSGNGSDSNNMMMVMVMMLALSK
jgi:hypothetical protein